ncbi:hypothetical protein MFLAVUS_009546 [Mucor flavus]|uniref:Uncharacterized protein n=1 Tax=Mucor flavus TaxID=439312 RepID=A0ABP9ZAF2_9FUNG
MTYLTKTKVSDWKYEDVIKQLLDLGFLPTDENNDLQKLGSIYKHIATKLKNENSVTYSEAEHRKMASVIEHMEFLCTASQIKKIIREKNWQYAYQQTLEDEVLDAATVKEDSWETKKKAAEKNFKNLSVTDKFAHLATYYGEDGILNLQHARLPKRFNKYLKKMKEEAGIDVKPFVTLEERDMLLEISNCKNTSELETLLSTWYSKKILSSNCKYIRFALSASVELWSTKALLNKTHGEDWYRLHVYSNVWDKAFLDDEELETKRSECVSQVTKILKEAKKDVKLQRSDFILRDMNNDTDVLTVEEKPSVKGVKADIRKGNMLKKHALYLWSKQVDSSVLMEKLEAISCQWQSTKFTIYGSRLLPSDTMLIYKKGSYSFPISSRHSPEFSKLLLAILSLKRTVKLNYAKFNLILEEKYKNEVKTLNFADGIFNEVSFMSNSTNSDGEYEDGYHEENEPEDEDFVENTKVMLDELKEDEKGMKRFHDWEDMLLFDCSKRKKT